MSISNKIDLSQIPLNILIAEVESRKINEINELVDGINQRLRKLNELGFIPYNKTLFKEDGERWDLLELGIDFSNDKITNIHYKDMKVEE